jgi:hypothetical protein
MVSPYGELYILNFEIGEFSVQKFFVKGHHNLILFDQSYRHQVPVQVRRALGQSTIRSSYSFLLFAVLLIVGLTSDFSLVVHALQAAGKMPKLYFRHGAVSQLLYMCCGVISNNRILFRCRYHPQRL